MIKHPALTDLFNCYRELDKAPTMILQDKQHLPVAALYLNRLACQHLLVSTVQREGGEKYYVVIDGKVGIFFTYYRLTGEQ